MALPLAVMAGCLLLLEQRVGMPDARALLDAIRAVRPTDWIVAGALAGVSFWAVGRYDGLLHRHLGTGVAPARARRSGVLAIALSQTLGLGLLTGAIARWRLLPEISLWTATRISAAVALTFLLGWAAILGPVLALTPNPGLAGIRPLLLGASLVIFACAWWQPRLPIVRFAPLPWPSLGLLGRICALVLVDTLAAGTAFWVLLGGPDALSLAALLPAYLTSFGLGLLSGTPGGVGPFELSLLGLLPGTDPGGLMAGILAFRLLYYALPAIAAAGFMALPRHAHRLAPPARPVPPGGDHLAALARAPAEHGLLRQGEAQCLDGPGALRATVRITPQALVALGDPWDGADLAFPARLAAAAGPGSRFPCLYKCSARQARAARCAGWQVAAIAEDAIVTPARHDLARPACRGLRRKLRKAAAGGIAVRPAPGALPLDAMADIARRWAAARGGERGFSMGRFAPDYVTAQQVYLAWRGPTLAGFATFHCSGLDWTLDLMRTAGDAPDGTMHSLIHAALTDAAAQGVPRLSLAAAPLDPGRARRVVERLLRRLLLRGAGGPGLRRFKADFAPRWEQRYIAAPGRIALLVAGLDIARAVHRTPTDPAPPHNRPKQLA